MPEIEENVAERLVAIERTLHGLAERSEHLSAVLVVLLNQVGDATHVSVDRAAELCECSRKTIRRRIERGELTLEIIPGTRKSGIPIEQIHSRWLPIGAARQAIERERSGGSLKRRRDRHAEEAP